MGELSVVERQTEAKNPLGTEYRKEQSKKYQRKIEETRMNTNEVREMEGSTEEL